jgi:hypothetical protein
MHQGAKMSMDEQRLKIFKIAQEYKGSPTRISHALIDAGFRDVGDLKCWLEGWINPNIPLEGNVIEIQDVLDKLESL